VDRRRLQTQKENDMKRFLPLVLGGCRRAHLDRPCQQPDRRRFARDRRDRQDEARADPRRRQRPHPLRLRQGQGHDEHLLRRLRCLWPPLFTKGKPHAGHGVRGVATRNDEAAATASSRSPTTVTLSTTTSPTARPARRPARASTSSAPRGGVLNGVGKEIHRG
jgi:hypothetical protein